MSEAAETNSTMSPEALAAETKPTAKAKRWYIIHAHSGFEKKVAQAILETAAQKGLTEAFEQVVVPTENVVEVRRGKKTATERKFFPGYVLAKMDMTDATWQIVKTTPKVTGFLGGKGIRPQPITEKEAMSIFSAVEEGAAIATSHDSLRHRRERQDHRRAVRELRRYGGRCGRWPQQAESVGIHLRPRNAGGAELRPGDQGGGVVLRSTVRSHRFFLLSLGDHRALIGTRHLRVKRNLLQCRQFTRGHFAVHEDAAHGFTQRLRQRRVGNMVEASAGFIGLDFGTRDGDGPIRAVNGDFPGSAIHACLQVSRVDAARVLRGNNG